MNDQQKSDHRNGQPKETVGAVFPSREEARHALGALHKAHFKKVWFGVTSVAIGSGGDQTLTAESGSGSFFAPNSSGLVDALVAHGIQGDIARSIEADIEPGEALVTVETDKRDPFEAIDILERFGGRTERSGLRTPVGAGVGSASHARTDFADTPYGEIGDLPIWEEEMFYSRGRR